MRKGWVVWIAAMAVLTAGSAWASDTNTLTVQAFVAGTCKFGGSKTSTLDFGTLDPSAGTPVNVSTSATFWCTRGINAENIAPDTGMHFTGGKNAMRDAVSGDLIPYTLTLTKDGSSNAGPSSPRTLTIAGNILGADYIGKSTGNYSDSVTITINP